MNLNGTNMMQRSMKLSSTGGDFELTRMEIACLKLTANGLKPAEIGSALHADDRDIEIHLSSAQRKLGARNRLHAVGIAVSQGLIGIDGK
jgi:DNA-binding CsgD family transcriptional regulator